MVLIGHVGETRRGGGQERMWAHVPTNNSHTKTSKSVPVPVANVRAGPSFKKRPNNSRSPTQRSTVQCGHAIFRLFHICIECSSNRKVRQGRPHATFITSESGSMES